MGSHYIIDNTRTDLARAFRDHRGGPYSIELQRVLNRMHWDQTPGRYVIATVEPHKKWVLAQLPVKRGAPLIYHDDTVFDSLASAEWHIFKLRWHDITGEPLALD